LALHTTNPHRTSAYSLTVRPDPYVARVSTLSGAPHEQTVSLLPLSDAATTLRELKSAGWSATDSDTTICVSWSGNEGVASRVAELASLRTAFIVVEVVGSRDGRELRLRDVGTAMEVRSLVCCRRLPIKVTATVTETVHSSS
jgi:hypothetical protein